MKFGQALLKFLVGAGIGVCTLCIGRALQEWEMEKGIEEFYEYKDTKRTKRIMADVREVRRGKGIMHVEDTARTGAVYDFSKWESDGDPIGISIGFPGAPTEDYVLSEVEVFEFDDGFRTWRSPPDAWTALPAI